LFGPHAIKMVRPITLKLATFMTHLALH
jgi:hypothetical protein